MIDKTEAYPKQPSQFEEIFKDSMQNMHELTFNALLSLGTVPLEGESAWLDRKVTDTVTPYVSSSS
jgi:hypothetical protein